MKIIKQANLVIKFNIYVDGTNNPKIPTCELFPLKAFSQNPHLNLTINQTPISHILTSNYLFYPQLPFSHIEYPQMLS